MSMPTHLSLAPIRRAIGTVTIPGSKSISNRALLLASLAEGTTRLQRFLECDDTDLMLEALQRLGVRWRREKDDLVVEGCSGSFPVKDADLYVGNSGTTMRFLTAALALQSGSYRLSGLPRMHERPIQALVDSLRSLGAVIEYEQKSGYPPITIESAAVSFEGGVDIDASTSSQYLTALLLTLAGASNKSAYVEVRVGEQLISRPYIDITLDLLASFSVPIERLDASTFRIPPHSTLRSPGVFPVEGDASSASYFLAAGAIGHGPVRVDGVGCTSKQGDVHFAKALEAMGASIVMGDRWIQVNRSPDCAMQGISVDCNTMPDAAITLAIVALFADGETTLSNIASWRVKETDRLAAMATELRKLGAKIQEGPDFLKIRAPEVWRAPEDGIETYEDHRIAMCFSLAAFGPSAVVINDPGCVSKTFPTYFDLFRQVCGTDV